MNKMYTEVMQYGDISRLREGIDPEKKWYTDKELNHILQTCSCILDRAAVKCYLGIIQKAKAKSDSKTVIEYRNKLNRFEAGFTQI